MIFRYAIKSYKSENKPFDAVLDATKQATQSFEEARRLSPDQEHAYISEVQTLIAMLDLAGKGRTESVRDVLARPDTDPFLRDALERAEDLLDRVQNLYAGERPNQYVLDCRARLQRIHGNFQMSLQAWDALLARPEVAKPPVRRQIVWTILGRHRGAWEKLNRKEVERARRLLEDNLAEEVRDSTSLRLWLRAIRWSQEQPSLDAVTERVSYWKTNTGSLDAAYYLYILHSLRALEGSDQALAEAERALEECRAIARFRRDRTRSFEWLGPGEGIQALVHQGLLGEWTEDFWGSTDRLMRVTGRIASIDAPQKGSIELPSGLSVFFVPAKADLHRGRDENALVTCYLGFSYDGLRGWDVKRSSASDSDHPTMVQ